MLVASSSEHPSFHVVALSLPNFGFSEGTKKKGFSVPQYVEVRSFTGIREKCTTYSWSKVGHKLMLALGYNEYGQS